MNFKDSYTVDIAEIQKYIQENIPIEAEQYKTLAPLVSCAYLKSLSDLNNLQKKLNNYLDNGQFNEIKKMVPEYENLMNTCTQDLQTYTRSEGRGENYDLGITKNSILDKKINWEEQIKIFKKQIAPNINSVFNESLIIPAMNLCYEQLKLLGKVTQQSDLKELQKDVEKNQKIYDKAKEELTQRQIEQTKLDITNRNGFVIKKEDMSVFIDKDIGWDSQKKSLKTAGLSNGQIEFIARHCNQSGITGGYAAAMTPYAKPCVNLIVDIDSKKNVILHSMSYATCLDESGINPSFTLQGVAELSVDISSLKEYEIGANKDVKFSFNSNILSSSPNSLLIFGIPEKLRSSKTDFENKFQNLESIYLQKLDTNSIISKLDDSINSPEIQQRIIQNVLFDKAKNPQDFLQKIKEQNVSQDVISGAITQHLSEFIYNELDSLRKSGGVLDSKTHQALNDKIFEEIKPLSPEGGDQILKKTISNLVLETTSKTETPLTISKTVEKWWGALNSLFHSSNKYAQIMQTIQPLKYDKQEKSRAQSLSRG